MAFVGLLYFAYFYCYRAPLVLAKKARCTQGLATPSTKFN